MKPANATVNGRTTLDYHGSVYELDADVSWTTLNNVGMSVGENKDGSRHTNIGVYGGNLYVDRSAQDQVPYSFGTFQQSQAPLASGTTSLHLRILVDHGSVEVFADDGRIALSNQAFFTSSDTGISLYTIGGSANFANLSITEFANITEQANPAAPYADFEGSTYGSWTTAGAAFGSGPASGALTNQQPVTGYLGNKLANSFNGGDAATGTLTSPSFTIGHSYVNFLAGGGNNPRPSDVFADFEARRGVPGGRRRAVTLARARRRNPSPTSSAPRSSIRTSEEVMPPRARSRHRRSRSRGTTSTSSSLEETTPGASPAPRR
ncbi:levanbiose-producing levanase [Arthrobacter sp. Hiyo8]|nr:levanbiose-producing levanase [Arthrobacter sp. Hiyo8]